MRVASNAVTESLIAQLQRLAARQTAWQQQAATGQRVAWPADDPAAMGRVLNLQSDTQTQYQYQANIARLQDQANATGSTLQSLAKIADRAREIVTLANNLQGPDQLNVYAIEVTQLIHQAAQLANTKFGDSYLFGGTITDQTPFTVTTGAADEVTAVTYHGNTSTPKVAIADNVTLGGTIPGANSTGAGGHGLVAESRTGADLFGHLIALQDHLRAADTTAIAATDRTALEADSDHLIHQVASNGILQTRLEAAHTVAGDRAATLDADVSRAVDVDIADAVTRLSQAESAYRIALQSTASILNTSLLDYLH